MICVHKQEQKNVKKKEKSNYVDCIDEKSKQKERLTYNAVTRIGKFVIKLHEVKSKVHYELLVKEKL